MIGAEGKAYGKVDEPRGRNSLEFYAVTSPSLHWGKARQLGWVVQGCVECDILMDVTGTVQSN